MYPSKLGISVRSRLLSQLSPDAPGPLMHLGPCLGYKFILTR